MAYDPIIDVTEGTYAAQNPSELDLSLIHI